MQLFLSRVSGWLHRFKVILLTRTSPRNVVELLLHPHITSILGMVCLALPPSPAIFVTVLTALCQNSNGAYRLK